MEKVYDPFLFLFYEQAEEELEQHVAVWDLQTNDYIGEPNPDIWIHKSREKESKKYLLEVDYHGPDLHSELAEPVLDQDYNIGVH